MKECLAAMAGQPPPILVSSASRARLDSIVSTSLSQGASDLIGNGIPKETGESTGIHFIPKIIGGITEQSDLWEEENFGPVVSYMTVESEDEAIKIANKTPYGLSAAVFTRDLRKGLALAKRLESGLVYTWLLQDISDQGNSRAVHINSMTVHDEAVMPFGGVKSSGWGRFNADYGMEEFLVTKTVTWDD
jgi:acyl-CoA reductase-like NAD-dependent aldehyde dehydrogenase